LKELWSKYPIFSGRLSRRIYVNCFNLDLYNCRSELYGRLQEVTMAKPNLTDLSVDALLKLRIDVESALSHRAKELESQLSRLGGEIGSSRKTRRSSLKGRKVAVKYRDKSGNTWAGRGAQPVWLRDKLKAGAKLEDFAINKIGATQRKSKKRRRAKR
jgi:DNA-binding protein H-NS